MTSGIEARVAELTEGANEEERLVIKMVLDTYLAKLPERLEAVVQAADRPDPTELRGCAHALKGASTNVGATRVAGVASTIEQLADAGRLDPARALLGQLTQAATDESLEMQKVAHTLLA